MNHFSKKEGNKRNSVIYMMLAFILLFSVAVFAQTPSVHAKEILKNTENSDVILQEGATNAFNVNFVLWFMGTKQDPNTVILPIRTTEMKQFRTSGTTLNRLLIRAFLKKAVNLEVTIA